MTIPVMPSQAANGVVVEFCLDDDNFGSGDLLFLAQVQLEAGPTATPFERRPIGVEQSLCERYYQIGDYSWIGNFTAAALVRVTIGLRQVMRAATPVATATKGYSDGALTSATVATTQASNNKLSVQFTSTGASAASEMSFSWTASAEL